MDHPRKPAPADFPILDAISVRWSSRAIGAKPVESEKIASLFEAARWAPSASNVQPWRFLYVTKDDGEDRAKVESLLNPGNGWAKNAYVLILGFAHSKRTNKEGIITDNPFALYDTGAASYALMMQAHSLGLAGRQMGGFDSAAANGLLGVPAEYVPATMIALGYPEAADALHPDHQAMETSPRMRKAQGEFVFHRQWKN